MSKAWNLTDTEINNFFTILQLYISDYYLEGTLKSQNVTDLVLGHDNPLAIEINSKMIDQDYTSYYWKTGDAILYNPKVTPFTQGVKDEDDNSVSTFTVETGADSTETTGKILLMNSYNFSNELTPVLGGFAKNETQDLPFPCSDVKFD